MLQFVTQNEDRYSLAEQCQMVLEGGCRWIQLHLDKGMDESAILEITKDIISMCKESEAFLILEDRPEIAEKLGIHGVHITEESGLNPISLREEMGPHAIIGVEVSAVNDILKLQQADLDYVTINPRINPDVRKQIALKAQESDNILPVVFAGDFRIEDLENIFREGASGVCIGQEILEAENPVEFTRLIIDNLAR